VGDCQRNNQTIVRSGMRTAIRITLPRPDRMAEGLQPNGQTERPIVATGSTMDVRNDRCGGVSAAEDCRASPVGMVWWSRTALPHGSRTHMTSIVGPREGGTVHARRHATAASVIEAPARVSRGQRSPGSVGDQMGPSRTPIEFNVGGPVAVTRPEAIVWIIARRRGGPRPPWAARAMARDQREFDCECGVERELLGKSENSPRRAGGGDGRNGRRGDARIERGRASAGSWRGGRASDRNTASRPVCRRAQSNTRGRHPSSTLCAGSIPARQAATNGIAMRGGDFFYAATCESV